MKMIVLIAIFMSLSAHAQTMPWDSEPLPLPSPSDGLELRTDVDAVRLIAKLAAHGKYQSATQQLAQEGCTLTGTTMSGLVSLCGGKGISVYNEYGCPNGKKMDLFGYVLESSCGKDEVDVTVHPK